MPTLTPVLRDFEFKAINGQIDVDEAEGIVECFVAAIGNKDSVGDIILPGAFDESFKRRKPRVVWGHDWNQPIGKVLEIYEVGPRDPRIPQKMRDAGVGGLYARVQFNLKSERGREAFNCVTFYGAEQEWSIGYKTIDAQFDPNRQANMLKTLELYEVSPVLHGANQLTATISIKSDQADDKVTSFRESKWDTFDRGFAEMIRTEHPDLWRKGGNIKGNDQYEILSKIARNGGTAATDDQIAALELREAWIARHKGDFRLPGVIAQIKWLAVGTRGEDYMKRLVREAIDRKHTKGDYGYDDPTDEVDEVMADNRDALARAIADEIGMPVKLRAVTANTVIFDARTDDDVQTMRASWHAERGQIMVGRPQPVEAQTVFLPEGGGPAEGYTPQGPTDAAIKAPGADQLNQVANIVGVDAPQEAVTGDVLRGYGPRRGNLERLLRYWRPIMKKPGGFRRCLVILADHPELYPLQNICAWLHHETTGLWPNEGCHHPGMKNCRRKLRGVTNGSALSDSEFNSRLSRAKSDDIDDDVTDDDIEFANKVLGQFVDAEPEFVKWVNDDKNWVHVGDNDQDEEEEHDMAGGEKDDDGWVTPSKPKPKLVVPGKPGGASCNCGCGKTDDDDVAEKAGRVLSSKNLAKLQQAITMIQEVIAAGGGDMAVKSLIAVDDPEDLFAFKAHIDPVLDFYGIDAEVTEAGVHIKSALPQDAVDALGRAAAGFKSLAV